MFGHEFADDQAEIGGDRDDERKAGFGGIFGAQAECGQAFADGAAQAGARKCAGDDRDESDADLRGGQQLALVALVAAPLVWLLDTSSDLVLRLSGVHDTGAHDVTTEELEMIFA